MVDEDFGNKYFCFFPFLNLPWDFRNKPRDREIYFKTVGPTAKPWDLVGLRLELYYISHVFFGECPRN